MADTPKPFCSVYGCFHAAPTGLSSCDRRQMVPKPTRFTLWPSTENTCWPRKEKRNEIHSTCFCLCTKLSCLHLPKLRTFFSNMVGNSNRIALEGASDFQHFSCPRSAFSIHVHLLTVTPKSLLSTEGGGAQHRAERLHPECGLSNHGETCTTPFCLPEVSFYRKLCKVLCFYKNKWGIFKMKHKVAKKYSQSAVGLPMSFPWEHTCSPLC